MKPDKSDKKIDELISRAIGCERPTFDFNKWQEDHQKEIQTYKAQAKKPSDSVESSEIWRKIMKSPITKLAAAAVIIITILGGINFWPDSSENKKWWLDPSAAWGRDILAELDIIEAVSCRERTMWIGPDRTTHTSSTWNIFYVSHDSYRRDIYDGDLLREIQWYVPDGNDMIQHYVRFDLKCYGATRHKGSFGKRDPVERMRFYVKVLDNTDKLLGEKVIEAHNCVGFEISASKYGDNPEEWLDRIWFDIDTRLPVLMEQERACPRDKTQTDFHPHITVRDRFDYNQELPADTFIPYEAPEGFINAHPDEIRANREQEQTE